MSFCRSILPSVGEVNRLIMQGLNPVLKSGSVALSQYIGAYLDSKIGSHSHEMLIKRPMMQPAECQTVADDRLPKWIRIRCDMGRVEQLLMAKAAERTFPTVSQEDALTEGPLVEPAPSQRGHVSPTGWGGILCDLPALFLR